MIYMAGKAAHKMSNQEMVEHIVHLVEVKAKSIEDFSETKDT